MPGGMGPQLMDQYGVNRQSMGQPVGQQSFGKNSSIYMYMKKKKLFLHISEITYKLYDINICNI